MTEKDIWDFEENGTRYEICYTPESIRHPAKGHIPLYREIIKRYTKPRSEFIVSQEMLDYWDKKIEWSQDDN